MSHRRPPREPSPLEDVRGRGAELNHLTFPFFDTYSRTSQRGQRVTLGQRRTRPVPPDPSEHGARA